MPSSTNCAASTPTAREFLIDLERRERERSGIANLKVEYNRVHGFYIEVTHANAERVPDDYRRRQTLKNAERYMTPELAAFESKALSAQERALACERRLFDALLAELSPAIPALQAVAAALATLDVLQTLAERADALRLTRPEFVPRIRHRDRRAAAIRSSSARSTRSSPTTSRSTRHAACS